LFNLFRTLFDRNSKEQETSILDFRKIFFLNSLKNTTRSFLLQARQNKTKLEIEIIRLFLVNEINLFLKNKTKLFLTSELFLVSKTRLLLKSKTKLLFTNELFFVSETRLLLKSKTKLLFISELLFVNN